MGYPMTWQRVVNRNGLQDGGYMLTPSRHERRVTVNADAQMLDRRVDEYERAFKSIAGDIRRLEADARDERLLAQKIAAATGVAPDDVAAVLLAFFAT